MFSARIRPPHDAGYQAVRVRRTGTLTNEVGVTLWGSTLVFTSPMVLRSALSSTRSRHWASVCLLSGVKRTEINGPQNFRLKPRVLKNYLGRSEAQD